GVARGRVQEWLAITPGRPHDPRALSGGVCNRRVAALELIENPTARLPQQVRVRVGVISDDVTPCGDLRGERGARAHVTADQKKRPPRVVLLQQIEHLRRHLRIRTVVERECDGAWSSGSPLRLSKQSRKQGGCHMSQSSCRT